MSKNRQPTKRAYLGQEVKISYCTIIDPRVYPEISGKNRREIVASDYIAVPRLATFGTFTLEESARFTPVRG